MSRSLQACIAYLVDGYDYTTNPQARADIVYWLRQLEKVQADLHQWQVEAHELYRDLQYVRMQMSELLELARERDLRH